MGKKSILSSIKNSPKHEKKQYINNLVKILRPKVFITDSSNFKKLVQELTGNRADYSPVSSPPPPPPQPQPPYPAPSEIPFVDSVFQDIHYHHQEDGDYNGLLFDSCLSTPSPELGLPDSFNTEKIDFSSQYRDLESFLMEMDTVSSSYTCEYGMMNMQQEVCAGYDYDLSSFI